MWQDLGTGNHVRSLVTLTHSNTYMGEVKVDLKNELPGQSCTQLCIKPQRAKMQLVASSGLVLFVIGQVVSQGQ